MTPRLKIGQVILIFALAAMPFAATFGWYYPDERHYTDGALRMLQQGHWLVPENADGSVRFEKPPLAYWAVAAGWRCLGVNPLAARLPFLLTSCGTLWLTYRLARKMTGSQETALLAVLMLAAHPQFFLCSVRSMPDSLLTFFITLSGAGFLRLVVWQELTPGAFWMAYGGAAGAAMGKGLLGAVIILFAWVFAYLIHFKWRDAVRIVHWPGLAVAVLMPIGWVGYGMLTHGWAAWDGLFGDQVLTNLDGEVWSPIWRAPVFVLILVVNCLPWSLPVIESWVRKRGWPTASVPLPAQKFILIWAALLVAGFSLGSNLSWRYLLPAMPLLSVLLADWLQNRAFQSTIFPLTRVLKAVLVLILVTSVAASLIDWEWREPVIIVAPVLLLFVTGTCLLWPGAGRKQYLTEAEALGVALVLGWLVVAAGYLPLALPDPARQTASALRQLPLGAYKSVLVVGDFQLAAGLRVELGPKWTIDQAYWLKPKVAANYTRFLVREPQARALAKRGWLVQAVATYPALPPRHELFQALASRTVREAAYKYGLKIYLATNF